MEKGNKIIVFDIDGTLANNSHRQHYVASKPKNWKAFNTTMHLDTLNIDIAYLLSLFRVNHVIICSGRSEEHREITEKWLKDNSLYYDELYMRKEGDHRSDAIVKSELLDVMISNYGIPHLWFDDRQQVVDAIRARGIRVLQVAPGDF